MNIIVSRNFDQINVCNLALVRAQFSQMLRCKERAKALKVRREPLSDRLVTRIPLLSLALTPIVHYPILLDLYNFGPLLLFKPEPGHWWSGQGLNLEEWRGIYRHAAESLEGCRKRRSFRDLWVFLPEFIPKQSNMYAAERRDRRELD